MVEPQQSWSKPPSCRLAAAVVVVAAAVAVAVAGAVANPIHPQLIKFVKKYTGFVTFKKQFSSTTLFDPRAQGLPRGVTIY